MHGATWRRPSLDCSLSFCVAPLADAEPAMLRSRRRARRAARLLHRHLRLRADARSRRAAARRTPASFATPIDDQLFELSRRAARPRQRARPLPRRRSARGRAAAACCASCSDSRLQRWRFADGRLSPASRPELCVALAAERGEPWGTPRLVSPAYRRQTLALADVRRRRGQRADVPLVAADRAGAEHAPTTRAPACRPTSPRRSRRSATSSTARSRSKPRRSTRRSRASTSQAKSPSRRTWRTARTSASASTSTRARAARPSPCPRSSCSTAAGSSAAAAARRRTSPSTSRAWATSASTAAIVSAPDAKWPEGARDVAAAVTWLRDHVAEYGGDPEQIFVAGISTGALHAATYVFRPELVPADAARPAGAILVSGPYTLRLRRRPGAASSRTSARTARAGPRWSCRATSRAPTFRCS